MFAKTKRASIFLTAVLIAIISGTALAQTSTSTSYTLIEPGFGSGGNVDVNSASYNARGAIGALGVGESSGTCTSAIAGLITPSEEYLEMVVSSALVDMGVYTNSATQTGSGTFYVRTYINGGYIVQSLSNPPTSESGRVLAAKSTMGAPAIGTEEFGINLVANTSPSVGANPYKQPDNTTNYANGIASTGYNTVNNFKYVVGDTIAQSGSGRAWGQTDYTISFMVNVSNSTPAGVYTMSTNLVVVATY